MPVSFETEEKLMLLLLVNAETCKKRENAGIFRTKGSACISSFK